MTKVKISFYKPTGKYYSSCIVELENHIYDNEIRQEIVDNQTELIDGWQGSYFVVLNDAPENYNNPDYQEFYNCLFQPWEFVGYKKRN